MFLTSCGALVVVARNVLKPSVKWAKNAEGYQFGNSNPFRDREVGEWCAMVGICIQYPSVTLFASQHITCAISKANRPSGSGAPSLTPRFRSGEIRFSETSQNHRITDYSLQKEMG